MTAKQKAARAKFKQVVKEASALRKNNPKLTQAQAVKQAWAIEYSKGKNVASVGKVKKSATKKAVKKAAPKKKAATKKDVSTHKDTKSHNVNIKVVSGVDKWKIEYLKEIESTKEIINDQIELLERLELAYKKSKSKINKEMLMMDIKTLKYSFIPHNKKHLKAVQNALKRGI